MLPCIGLECTFTIHGHTVHLQGISKLKSCLTYRQAELISRAGPARSTSSLSLPW